MKTNENDRSNQPIGKQHDGVKKDTNTERGQAGTARDNTLRPEAGSQKGTQGNASELKQRGTDVRDTAEKKEELNDKSSEKGEEDNR